MARHSTAADAFNTEARVASASPRQIVECVAGLTRSAAQAREECDLTIGGDAAGGDPTDDGVHQGISPFHGNFGGSAGAGSSNERAIASI